MAVQDLSIAMKISAEDNASPALKALQTNMSGVLAKTALFAASSAAFVNLAAAIKNSIMPASQFNRELMRISLTADNTTGKVKELYDSIYDNAQLTGVDTQNLAVGYSNLAAGGLNTEEITSVMSSVSKAMIVSTATAEQLSNAVAVAGKSFGLELNSENSQKMLDQMYQAGKLGNAELEDLSMILSRVAPQAKLAGLGLEETLAFMEGMAESRENPEIVATMSRAVLKMFNDENLRKKIEEHTGAQFFNADGSRNDAFDIFGSIQNAYLSKDTDLERSKLFETMFFGADDRTKNGLLSIIGNAESVDKMRAMYDSIAKANGVIAKDAEEFEKNYSFQSGRLAQTLKRARESAGKSIGDLLVAPLKAINDTLRTGDYGNAMIAGTIGTGLLAGSLALGGLGKLGKLGGGLGKAVVGSQIAEKLGVPSVFVTNMPPVMGGFADMGGKLGLLSKGLGVLSAASLGVAIGQALNEHMKQNPDGLLNTFTNSVVDDIMNIISPEYRNMKKWKKEEERRKNYASLKNYDDTDYGNEETDRRNRERFERENSDGVRLSDLPKIDNNISVSVFMDKNGKLIDQKVLEDRKYADGKFSILDR